jgi:purine-binding chemotaxis protein CheW
MSGARQLATFRAGGLSLGIDVLQVQEVLQDQRLAPVPLAPDTVAGLINLRGQIVPALDLDRLLLLSERRTRQAPISLVVTTPAGPVSLQADEVGDVIAVDRETFEPAPRNLEPAIRPFVEGVHKLEDRLLLVLSVARLLSAQGYEGNSSNEP